MKDKKQNISEEDFGLHFLVEANLNSESGIFAEVPTHFIQKHQKLIEKLNHRAEAALQEQLSPRKWNHKSVLKLISETAIENPLEAIKQKARQLVLRALQLGWNGPPFSSIELAQLLGFEVMPNDKIFDARTIPLKNNSYRIEYNPFQKPTRVNFSVAHEISHTLFPDCREEIRNREESPEANRELEQLCNVGASELQLPYVIFPSDSNSIQDITIESLIILAQKYKSSLESVFNGFVSSINRPCAFMICTLKNPQELELDYFKTSSSFSSKIPEYFKMPLESRAYLCSMAGSTERETVCWPFLNEEHDAFYVGLSPLRKENKSRIAVLLVPNNGRERLQNRKIVIESGDATKPRGAGTKIIAQLVNTSAGLGFGFGKSLAKNYPVIKDALKNWKERKPTFKLGNTQMVKIQQDLYVCQMLAQNGLFVKNGKIPLDYSSLQMCLVQLREEALHLGADIYMPLIGAGQAKGKWEIIEGLIYSELVNYNVKVHIYIWGPQKTDDFRPKASLSLFNEESTWRKEN